MAVLRPTEARLGARLQSGQALPCLQLCDVGSVPSGLAGLLPTVMTMTLSALGLQGGGLGYGGGGFGQEVVRVWSWWIVGSRGQSEVGLGRGGG